MSSTVRDHVILVLEIWPNVWMKWKKILILMMLFFCNWASLSLQFEPVTSAFITVRFYHSIYKCKDLYWAQATLMFTLFKVRCHSFLDILSYSLNYCSLNEKWQLCHYSLLLPCTVHVGMGDISNLESIFCSIDIYINIVSLLQDIDTNHVINTMPQGCHMV